jgi:hypothetical protein
LRCSDNFSKVVEVLGAKGGILVVPVKVYVNKGEPDSKGSEQWNPREKKDIELLIQTNELGIYLPA